MMLRQHYELDAKTKGKSMIIFPQLFRAVLLGIIVYYRG